MNPWRSYITAFLTAFGESLIFAKRSLSFLESAFEVPLHVQARSAPENRDVVVVIALKIDAICLHQNSFAYLHTELEPVGSEPMFAGIHVTGGIAAFAHEVRYVEPPVLWLINVIRKCDSPIVASEFTEQVSETNETVSNGGFEQGTPGVLRFKDAGPDDGGNPIDVCGKYSLPKEPARIFLGSCHA